MIEIFKSLSSAATIAFAPMLVVAGRAPDETSALQVHPTTARAMHVPNVEPSPPGAQWRQLAQGIEARLRSAQRVAELQSAALVQVDVADFALARIIEDLACVMPRASALSTRALRPTAFSRQALAA